MGERGRLWVSGASGFLGAHVVGAAARAGFEVLAQVHDAALPMELPGGARAQSVDLGVRGSVTRALEIACPQVVLHAAALSRMAACERDPQLARRVNVDATLEIAQWCAAHDARLVHVSTDLVFGASAAPPGGFSEDEVSAPISVYGASKLDAERAVRAAGGRSLCVRLPLLLGPSHGRALGASDAVRAATGRGEIPALFEDEWRTPLDVRSAAEALIELCSHEARGCLHVAAAERMSRYELGLRALRQAGLRADQARERLRATTRAAAGQEHSRPADVSLNADRARGLLTTLLVGLGSGSK